MKISYNWLQQYVDLPADATPVELAELLTSTGLEVEKMYPLGVAIANVVVAQINESVQHPNADRLSVCQVDDGSGTPRQIVCGAKNYKVGDKVPLALPGAVLPGDFKIKASKLRGVESQGMLCSPKELALADDAEGLLILPPDSRIGAPLSELFPGDTLLDLEVTSNRPDWLSHLGIAREVAALTESPFKGVRARKPELDYSKSVEVSAEECPFYTARALSNVTVGASPAWLRERLESIGLRAINNIVDVTNFVLWEMGQPLHAFDADKLQGALRVRLAEAGEEFAALDGRTYQLADHHLVIADERGPVAIAGVMGGAATGVTATTKNVWLESAYFCASSIRRTSRELGLSSDSSYRFEREVDPAGVLVASQHATELIQQIAGGAIGELRIGFAADSQFGFDAEGAAEGHEYGETIPFRPERCTAVLGLEVAEESIDGILGGFGLKKVDGGWQAPSFRPDLTREVDLIEEVARVVGIGEVPAWHFAKFGPASAADVRYDRTLELRRRLASLGLHEARGLTLQPAGALRLKNPLGEEGAFLRASLVPGLLEALARNTRAGEKSIRLFEIGRIFTAEGAEATHAAVLLAGDLAELARLRGLLESALDAELQFEPAEPTDLLAVRASISWRGQPLGFAGQLWPQEARKLDVSSAAVLAELDLGPWLAAPAEPKRFREVPKFPAITRDVAFIAPIGLAHAEVVRTLGTPAEPLLAEVSLFDVFTDPTGAKVPSDKKSVAYSLTYRSPERTLTADEINTVHLRLKGRLQSQLGVQFRE